MRTYPVNLIRAVARPMLASMFVVGGIDALKDPQGKVPDVEPVTDPLADQVPALADVDTATMIRANGAAQLAGGLLLAMGKMPRLASTVLAASLVPTTMAGHRFWEEEDPGARANQQVHFFKNVSMMGGLAIAAMDTEGRPGLVWRAGHALEHAEQAADRSRREARLARKLARAEAKNRARRVTSGRSAREAKLAAKLARARTKQRATPDVFDAAKGVRSLLGSDES